MDKIPEDSKLILDMNTYDNPPWNYIPGSQVDMSNFMNNVMLYPSTYVNGIRVGDVRSEAQALQATPGQIQTIEQNIEAGKINGEAKIGE